MTYTITSINDFWEDSNKHLFRNLIIDGRYSISIKSEDLTKIFEYKRLEYISLDNVRIDEIPNNIHLCKELKTLILKNIKGLKKLPDGLSKLPKLRVLHLENVALEALPAHLGSIASLRHLILRRMTLPPLPDAFEEWSALEELNLQHTQLHTLPNFMSALPNLRVLKLDNNQLSTLPQLQCPYLQTLCISKNAFVELPDNWSQFPHLQTLECENNQLTTLPPSFSELKELVRLDLRGNPFPSFPAMLLHTDSLENIVLDDTQKTNFGLTFTQKNNLKTWFQALRKANIDAKYRFSLYYIFSNSQKQLKTLPYSDLLEALRLRHAPTSLHALREISERAVHLLANHPLKKGCNVATVGDCAFKKNELKAQLLEKGVALTFQLKPSTTHVLVGKNLNSWEGLDRKDLVLLTEQQMNDFLNQDADLYLLEPENQADTKENIENLLASADTTNVELGFQLLQTGGISPAILPTLFMMVKNTQLEASIRKKARQLVMLHASDSIKKELSKPLGIFAYYCHEYTVRESLQKIAQTTEMSLYALASYIYQQTGRGWSALLQSSPHKMERKRVVQEILATDASMPFSPIFFQNPDEIYEYQAIKNITFENMELTEFPLQVLKLPNLTEISVKKNPISQIPPDIQQLKQLHRLDISYTNVSAFPHFLVGMESFHELICKSAPVLLVRNHSSIPLDEFTVGQDFIYRAWKGN